MARVPAPVFDVTRRVCARLGYALIPAERLNRLPQAEYLVRLFRDFRITGVIDIGANEGQYHDFIRDEVLFRGPVVSVEPIPSLVGVLRSRAMLDPQWTIEDLAMGPAAGSSSFLVTAGSQFSSFLEPLEQDTDKFHGQTAINESITVRVDTLDALIDRHGALLGDRIYLKLDTQGYDLEALKGLSRHAARIVALQSEASVRPIYKSMPNYQDTIRFVESMGFTVSQMFPNNEGHFPLLIEFDCHFVRLP